MYVNDKRVNHRCPAPERIEFQESHARLRFGYHETSPIIWIGIEASPPFAMQWKLVSRVKTGRSKTLPWWLVWGGVKMTENKIHWPRCPTLYSRQVNKQDKYCVRNITWVVHVYNLYNRGVNFDFVLSRAIFFIFLNFLLCLMTTFSFSLPALERAQSQDFEVEIMFCHHCDDSLAGHRLVQSSVADPDPSDPYVFEPPGSGSRSISLRDVSGSVSDSDPDPSIIKKKK